MKKRALRIHAEYRDEYYLFPEKFNSADELIDYLGKSASARLSLTKLSVRGKAPHARFPYFIEEECIPVFLKIGKGVEIEVVEIKLLTRAEYNQRLVETVDRVCSTCSTCNNWEIEQLEGDWRINLDGNCPSYQKNRSGERRPSSKHYTVRYY